jgi:RNA polymerase sigma-70 factor (ECF subfamily)
MAADLQLPVDDQVSFMAAASAITTGLLGRVQQQDPEAWRRLDFLYRPIVTQWAQSAGLQPDDAADLAQEVFRAVSSRIIDFKRETTKDTFRGWLWTITRNKLRRYWHDRQKRPTAIGGSEFQMRLGQFPIDDDASVSIVEPGEVKGLVTRGMERVRAEFEDRTWQAFWRLTVDNQSAAEVAADLAMTTGAVYVAKSRVLRRLREELGNVVDSLLRAA